MESSNVKVANRFGLVLVLVALPAIAFASGARQGVTAKPGEIVLLRDVSARPAYRPAPPGQALIVDTSPRRELSQSLGTPTGMDELSDGDYAELGSAPQAAPTGTTTVERMTGNVVGATLGRVTQGGVLSGGQLGQTIGGPLGAVGASTRGIGDQVRGALAQFPLGQPSGAPGK